MKRTFYLRTCSEGVIICSFILLVLVSCNRRLVPEIKKGTAVVAGCIRFSGKPEVVVTLVSVNAMYSNRYSLILDEQEDFLFRTEMLHPYDINLRYQEGYVGLYLQKNIYFCPYRYFFKKFKKGVMLVNIGLPFFLPKFILIFISVSGHQ